jgi:hypothetical protein
MGRFIRHPTEADGMFKPQTAARQKSLAFLPAGSVVAAIATLAPPPLPLP